MALKKDKQKVLGESFDDERIKTFLHFAGEASETTDYDLLEKAYRGMIAENFSRFVVFFKEAGFNLDAKNANGEAFLETIQAHQQADDYIAAVQAAK